MNKTFLMDSLGWGFILWLIGYVLGIVFYMLVPPSIIGWVIMPIGILILVWVVLRKIHTYPLPLYILLAALWTLIAVVCDYFFLVKLFHPVDGYYKLDVYLYYALTFIAPPVIGTLKKQA